MKFYHYTNAERLTQIFGNRDNAKAGLVPKKRVISLSLGYAMGLPEATEGAVFGLLDPMDHSWCENTFHYDEPLLETVLRDIGETISLLEITLSSSDDVRVADYSPNIRAEYRGKNETDEATLMKTKRDYWNSSVHLSSYIKQKLSHHIPEVLCFTEISPERIRLVTTKSCDVLCNEIRADGGFAPHAIQPKKNSLGLRMCAPGRQAASSTLSFSKPLFGLR
ncbi:MAG: hypothetical protein WC612_04710 [Bdellovibrionales bacterium]|jgi:hypothetical protein